MQPHRLSLALIALLTASMLPSPVASEELAAVILRRRPLLTPVETAGTGLAPSVGVKVTVGPGGRVASVDVTSVHPSTDFDQVFAEAVESSLAEWRFAPALDGGRPVSSELSWSLQFLPAEVQPDGLDLELAVRGDSSVTVDDLGLARLLSDAPRGNDRLLRIFTLPVDQQLKHLERLIEAAEPRIDPAHRKSVSGAGFTVVTDHRDDHAAEIVHGNLAAVFTTLNRMLGGDIPLGDSGVPVVAYVFWSESQYRTFIAAIDGIEESSGVFCPPGLIAIHAERAARETLLSTLIHEAVHAFLYRHVVTPGRQLPRWLNEGFADYVGNSKVTKKGLELGKKRATQFYRSQAGIWRGRTLAQVDFDSVRKTIRRGESLSVHSILSAGRDTFYGERMSLYYAQSWILVHLLRHGEPGWAERQFPDLMLLAAEGYPVKDAVEQIYGTTVDQLERRYVDYAQRF